MELKIFYDNDGTVIEAHLCNLSYENRVLMQLSLEDSCKVAEERLEYFEGRLELKKQHPHEYNSKAIQDMQVIVNNLQNKIKGFKSIIHTLDNPVFTDAP